jgi:hypothetical protein
VVGQEPHQTVDSARSGPCSAPLRGMVKSFFAPQTEMNQTEAQHLMFSGEKTVLENILEIKS